MVSDRCIAHHGLLNAIGSCSDETKAVLVKALSYFGITCTTSKQNSTANSAFHIAFQDEGAINDTEQIRFDGERRLWHRVRAGDCVRHRAGAQSRNGGTSPDLPTVSGEYGACWPLSKSIREDWTTLLPSTDHVELLKSREWQKTDLGPMLEWPSALKLMTMKMLGDPRPANLYWGNTRIAIYNEPFSILAASRHPMMMGSTAEEAMPATYPFLATVFKDVEATGAAFSMPEFEMTVEKVAGFTEEAWYDGVFSPILDIDGTFLGIYNSGYEVTEHIFARRNADLVHQIATGPASPDISLWQHIIHVSSKFDKDLPFLVLYSADEQEAIQSSGLTVRYQGSLGIGKDHPALPDFLDLYDGHGGFRPLLRAAVAKKSSIALEMPGGKLPDFLSEIVFWRGHGDTCTHIIATPLLTNGLLTGFIIMGLNPRRRYDEAHKQFVEDVGRVANSLLSYGISVSQAQIREERLTEELTRRQKFLQQIAEVATVGIYTFSSEGLLTWGNPMYFDITGLPPATGERFNYQGIEYIAPEDREKGREGFIRCLETKSTCTLELRLMKTWQPPESQQTESCCILTTFTPNIEDDKVIDILGFVTDISHLKWAEKVQTEAAETAKRAKQQQERFIDVTSHEMRNPLSAILQCADDITAVTSTYENTAGIYSESAIQEAIKSISDNAKSISFCAAHQNRIVDDILTVSKLDSSMLTVTPVAVNPSTVIVQTMQAFAAKMAAEGIQAQFQVQTGYTDLQITSTYSDPSRITQILINLITNAIKFTRGAQRKEISVRLNAVKQRPLPTDSNNRVEWFPSNALLSKLGHSTDLGDADELIYLMFEVQDSGAGISKEEMQHLFNRFAQATPKTHITYGGSGLGLFISRSLAEIQGGMIGVSSQPGTGSIFTFFIETRKVTSAVSLDSQIQQAACHEVLNMIGKREHRDESEQTGETSSSEKPTLQSPARSSKLNPSSLWSVLLVEDNLVNQKILSKQLVRRGCVVRVANHGIEALTLIQESNHWRDNEASEFRIDVVLMDWEMPFMDGVTCTKRIRELEATGSITTQLLIIGATANARPEQVGIALAAGMDDVITKPFTVTALTNRIESFLPQLPILSGSHEP